MAHLFAKVSCHNHVFQYPQANLQTITKITREPQEIDRCQHGPQAHRFTNFARFVSDLAWPGSNRDLHVQKLFFFEQILMHKNGINDKFLLYSTWIRIINSKFCLTELLNGAKVTFTWWHNEKCTKYYLVKRTTTPPPTARVFYIGSSSPDGGSKIRCIIGSDPLIQYKKVLRFSSRTAKFQAPKTPRTDTILSEHLLAHTLNPEV